MQDFWSTKNFAPPVFKYANILWSLLHSCLDKNGGYYEHEFPRAFDVNLCGRPTCKVSQVT